VSISSKKQQKAAKSSKKQQKAAKSSKKQQKAAKSSKMRVKQSELNLKRLVILSRAKNPRKWDAAPQPPEWEFRINCST
jgi:hypothetical protein